MCDKCRVAVKKYKEHVAETQQAASEQIQNFWLEFRSVRSQCTDKRARR